MLPNFVSKIDGMRLEKTQLKMEMERIVKDLRIREKAEGKFLGKLNKQNRNLKALKKLYLEQVAKNNNIIDQNSRLQLRLTHYVRNMKVNESQIKELRKDNLISQKQAREVIAMLELNDGEIKNTDFYSEEEETFRNEDFGFRSMGVKAGKVIPVDLEYDDTPDNIIRNFIENKSFSVDKFDRIGENFRSKTQRNFNLI